VVTTRIRIPWRSSKPSKYRNDALRWRTRNRLFVAAGQPSQTLFFVGAGARAVFVSVWAHCFWVLANMHLLNKSIRNFLWSDRQALYWCYELLLSTFLNVSCRFLPRRVSIATIFRRCLNTSNHLETGSNTMAKLWNSSDMRSLPRTI